MTGFAANFSLGEFERASKGPLGPGMVAYAARLSHVLQAVRDVLGGPIVVTSFYRPESTTQHGEGTAVDWRLPPGVSSYLAALKVPQILSKAGITWGQLIFYPWAENHVHVSLPTGRSRNALLVQLRDKSYVTLTGTLLASFPGAPSVTPADVTGVYVPGKADPAEVPRDENESIPWALLGALGVLAALGLALWRRVL